MVGTPIDRKVIETQPIRLLGEHKVKVRLTMDLTPEIKVMVYREGEAIPSATTPVAEKKSKVEEAPVEVLEEPETPIEEVIETPEENLESPAEENAEN